MTDAVSISLLSVGRGRLGAMGVPGGLMAGTLPPSAGNQPLKFLTSTGGNPSYWPRALLTRHGPTFLLLRTHFRMSVYMISSWKRPTLFALSCISGSLRT